MQQRSLHCLWWHPLFCLEEHWNHIYSMEQKLSRVCKTLDVVKQIMRYKLTAWKPVSQPSLIFEWTIYLVPSSILTINWDLSSDICIENGFYDVYVYSVKGHGNVIELRFVYVLRRFSCTLLIGQQTATSFNPIKNVHATSNPLIVGIF